MKKPPHQNPRALALQILTEWESGHRRIDDLLDYRLDLSEVRGVDRALAAEIVLGTIRWLRLLDHILSSFLEKSLATLTPSIRNILRLGAYQILRLERVPDFAAVDECVNLAKRFGHQGVAGLVNAVLRRVTREGEEVPLPPESDLVEHLGVKHSLPSWLVERWVGRFGAERAEELMATCNQRGPLVVRPAGGDADSLIQLAKGRGLDAKPGSYVEDAVVFPVGSMVGKLPDWLAAAGQVQDESSIMVGRLVAARKDGLVVDVCAAPGGKATQCAEAVGPKGVCLAADISLSRMAILRENRDRLGLDQLIPIVADARYLEIRCKAASVLADVPCSGLGVLRRRVDLRWRMSADRIPALAQLQREILDQAAKLVAPGGTLVYCTCTTEPEENEEQVKAFLEDHLEFALQSASGYVPDEVIDDDGYLRTWPDKHGLDGTFAARLVKAS